MSRSNPTANNSPHPCTRWFEWNGEEGGVRYYDKNATNPEKPAVKGCNISVPDGFTFILLDVLSCVKGWHEASKSGIASNEVRDTIQEAMVVKAFKGGVIAKGFYRDIKDRVNVAGGNFTAKLYIGYKDDEGELVLGAVEFKGASLNAWVEFKKQNAATVWEKAIRIKGFTEGKKGRITYRMPVFSIVEISAEANDAAKEVDKTLQQYLDGYFKRTRVEQAQQAVEGDRYAQTDENDHGGVQGHPEPEPEPEAAPPDDSDVPF